jgi:hypothetical protein
LLAAYRAYGDGQSLDEFVRTRAFAAIDTVTTEPSDVDAAGYDAFLSRYSRGLDWARAASYSV